MKKKKKRIRRKTPFKHRLPPEERKALILEAAGRVLCQYGYDGATLDKFAKEAGISKTLIVNYYEKKENLAKLFIHQYMDSLTQKIEEIAERMDGDVAQTMDAMFEFVCSTRAEFRLIVSIVSTPNLAEEMREVYLQYFESFRLVFQSLSETMDQERLKSMVYIYCSILVSYAIGGDENNFKSAQKELLAHYLDDFNRADA